MLLKLEIKLKSQTNAFTWQDVIHSSPITIQTLLPLKAILILI